MFNSDLFDCTRILVNDRSGRDHQDRSHVGPHAQSLEVVKPIAARKGLDIQLVECSDYGIPNAAPDDVNAAAITTNYVTEAGSDPVKDPILREDPKGPYVNLIAVRSVGKDKPWVKILVDSYHAPEIREFVLTKFKGAVLPS